MSAFVLPVGHYRLYPKSKLEKDLDESNFGHETRPMEFSTENTAIISIDTWNCTYDDKPFYPEWGKYHEYGYFGGGLRMAKHAKDVMDNFIAPLFDAARKAGLLVIHCNTRYIISDNHREKYAKYIPPKPAQTWTNNYNDDWPPEEFRLEVTKDYISRTWGEDAWDKWPAIRAKMDFAPSVQPQAGDVVIPQSPEGRLMIQETLKQRKILNLFYVGFMANGCVLLKPGGILEMEFERGYRTVILSDCVSGNESAATIDGFKMTKMFMTWYEIYGTLTANSKDLIKSLSGNRRGG